MMMDVEPCDRAIRCSKRHGTSVPLCRRALRLKGRSARLRSAARRSQQDRRSAIAGREVVRAAGLEPAQAFRPYGFSYHYGFRRARRRAVRREALCGLDYTFTVAFALGAARLVSTPSRHRAWLGIAI